MSSLEVNKYFKKNVYKNVNGLNITSGEEYEDLDIKNSLYAIIYYGIDSNAEVKSFVIPNTDMFDTNVGYSRWFRDVSNSKTIYVRVWWEDGKISLSPGSSNDATVNIKGYTLIFG